MDDTEDYYSILYVHHDAPVEIIKSSYRTLMQRLKQHPDLGGDHDNASLINQAYTTLTDAAKRAEYDRTRTAARKPSKSRRPKSRTNRSSAPGQCVFCKAPQPKTAMPKEALCDNCMSPLYRSEHQAVETSGRSALERFAKQQPISFYTAWPDRAKSGNTQDISLNGMQFSTKASLAVDQLIKIDCDACRAIARVAHIERKGRSWVVGVEFINLRFEKAKGTFVSTRA